MDQIQIYFINLSLQHVDQLIVVPTFSVVLEVFSIIEGIIYFKEYEDFSWIQFFMFPLSILVTFLGVYLTTMGQRTATDTIEIKRSLYEHESENVLTSQDQKSRVAENI